MELLHQTVHLNVATVAFVAGDASIFAQVAGLLRIPIAVASIVLHLTKLKLLMKLTSIIVHVLPTFMEKVILPK